MNRQLEQEWERDRAELRRLRAALEHIHERYGQVCGEYEFCEHASCWASYGAWATADIALKGHSIEAIRGERLILLDGTEMEWPPTS